jgi:hypothetical protein
MKSRIAISAATLLAASALAAGAHATQLLTNGNFETGDFTGWTVTNQAGGSGDWFIAGNGTGSPMNGFGTPTNPAGGTFNAQTDQGGPGSHTLSQSFATTGSGTFSLSFDAFADDQSGQAPVGVGTDYTTTPNQHFEIDIQSGAGPEALVFSGTFADAWSSNSFNLTPFIGGAGTYTLSFTEVDNQGFYNVGLDNVSLTQSGGVPEPASWALMLTGFAGLGAMLRNRRRVMTAA